MVLVGLGQGLCRTPWPMVSTRLCADTTGLGESRLSGPNACRTVDRPRTPWWHTQEGDAAVPVCVPCAGQEGGACMLVALAGHDGSHGCAAPGPARWHRCRSSVSGFPPLRLGPSVSPLVVASRLFVWSSGVNQGPPPPGPGCLWWRRVGGGGRVGGCVMPGAPGPGREAMGA